MIDTEAATHGSVLKNIERFTLAGDFRVTDLTNQTATLSVQGQKAVAVVRAALGDVAAEIGPNRATQIQWPRNAKTAATGDVKEGVIVMRATHTAEDGFDFVVPANEAGSLFEAFANAGAQPVGSDALEMLRIEAGLPRYGLDMDETNVVTEAALDDAVSYTKGCYVGQEIIARIKYRGHVAKKLSGLMFEQALPLAVGVAVQSLDGKEIGKVTSATYSPHLGRTIALAYLKYDYLAPGTSLKITSEATELPAQVTELPLVKGSWRAKL